MRFCWFLFKSWFSSQEQLQKEPSIDKVVMNGIKHTVIKSLIEFIYCGETMILEDNIQELVAVANYFELRGIKAILPQKLNILNPEGKGEYANGLCGK